METKKENLTPAYRKLKGYAFDPSLSLNLDTFEINKIQYSIPWEDLKPGPVGEYVEVIDYDPTLPAGDGSDMGTYYSPVDLNDSYILAENGLEPSDSNPQFHQQMVYAVAMTTIKNFEYALGRKVLWSEHIPSSNSTNRDRYVGKLRIFPHAMRQANAYYSPTKKAILFGYFRSFPAEKQLHMPNSYVFTCLSHDIIAHEVTHAILDGMNRYYNEPTNPDVLAFHEAFADVVALFQHFTFPEVLKHQIAKTRGNLEQQNLLGELAQEFGSAIGGYGSLRSAIGQKDKDGWQMIKPDPAEYETIMEPHGRGSILVAAIFDAFLSIYKRRIADLIRIASEGRGILPEGELHPDLVNRLASEASKTARHILNICIRAIDYCPPVDLTFGAYLRGIITADLDLVSDDKNNYRLAFIQAFKKRGIYPIGIKTLSVDSLRYRTPNYSADTARPIFKDIASFLRLYRNALMFEQDRKKIHNITKRYIAGRQVSPSDKNPSATRTFRSIHQRITWQFDSHAEFEKITGIFFNSNFRAYGCLPSSYGKSGMIGPAFVVTNLRLISRIGPDGEQVNQIIFAMVQTARVFVDRKSDPPYKPAKDGDENYTKFRGGATMIFDLDTLDLKYSIITPIAIFKDDPNRADLYIDRLLAQHDFVDDFDAHGAAEFEKYFGIKPGSPFGEPFALLHNHSTEPHDSN